MKTLRETLAALAIVLVWAAVAHQADADLRARQQDATAAQRA